jgi:hypothetical protein
MEITATTNKQINKEKLENHVAFYAYYLLKYSNME